MNDANDSSHHSVLAEIHDLKQRLADLEARLDQQPATVAASSSNAVASPAKPSEPVEVSSRRNLLKLAGSAAVGAVAVTAVGAKMAAADRGVLLQPDGTATDSPFPVHTTYSGTAANTSGFVFEGGKRFGTNVGNISAAALAGWAANDGSVRDGVYGFTEIPAGFGIVGNSATGTGGSFQGQRAAIQLVTGANADPRIDATTASVPGMIQADATGNIWFCVKAATQIAPPVWQQIGGPTVAGGFHALTPGRVYDSRVAAPTPGAIKSGGTRTVSVANRRSLVDGSVAQADFVPAGATAITCNVTVVNTTAQGFLAINPGGNTTVNAAAANWSAANQILNNGASLTLNGNREVTVIAGGGGTTDFILDVTGYYL